jgi:hypothetical protein
MEDEELDEDKINMDVASEGEGVYLSLPGS